MIINILLVLVGFGLLIKGADWLVNGASALAKKHRVSDLVIGLTIVALGTSMPELVVNVVASFEKHSDIVYGNVIGSNVFNLLVILGITSLIYPVVVNRNMVRREIPFSLLVTVVVILLSNRSLWQDEPILSRLDSVILFLLLIVFIYFTFKNSGNNEVSVLPENETQIHEAPMSNMKIWGLIAIGLAGLVAGGRLVVDNAVTIAENLGISEKIIGLTIVAAGTSLPELVTSVVAASKKNSDIAIGNVIGSNILNILFILSVSGLINPIPFNDKFNAELGLLCLGTVLVILFTFIGKKNEIGRWKGAALLGIFIAYTVYLIQHEM